MAQRDDVPNSLAAAIAASQMSTHHMCLTVCAVLSTVLFWGVWVLVYHDELGRARADYVNAQALWRTCMTGMGATLDTRGICNQVHKAKDANPFLVAMANTSHRLFGWMIPSGISGTALGLITAMLLQIVQSATYSFAFAAGLAAFILGYIRYHYSVSQRSARERDMFQDQRQSRPHVVLLDSAHVRNRWNGGGPQICLANEDANDPDKEHRN